MINKGLFDLIYHEHLSYFALTPLKFLFNKFGIKIVNFERLNLGASGPAIRLFLAKNKSIYPSSKKVMKQIKYEKMWGINKMKRYNFFNYRSSKNYLKKYEKPKIITITNVLAQINNLNEFAKGLNNITNKESLIVI